MMMSQYFVLRVSNCLQKSIRQGGGLKSADHCRRRWFRPNLHFEVLRLWATHTFPIFAAFFMETGSPTPRMEEVSQLLAVRISNFGGLVRNLVPGASIHNDNLKVIAFKTRSRLRYLRFMAAVWFRRHTYSSTIELVDCVTVECRDHKHSAEPLFVEADGELLGTLPVRIEVVPQALILLIPQSLLSGTVQRGR
jgi:diacylglycerol kinase (ATP)